MRPTEGAVSAWRHSAGAGLAVTHHESRRHQADRCRKSAARVVSQAAGLRTQTPAPSPNNLPRRTATAGETGLRSFKTTSCQYGLARDAVLADGTFERAR